MIMRISNVNLISKYSKGESSKEMFSEGEIDDLVLEWTNKFIKFYSKENYRPHITLGVGDFEGFIGSNVMGGAPSSNSF